MTFAAIKKMLDYLWSVSNDYTYCIYIFIVRNKFLVEIANRYDKYRSEQKDI